MIKPVCCRPAGWSQRSGLPPRGRCRPSAARTPRPVVNPSATASAGRTAGRRGSRAGTPAPHRSTTAPAAPSPPRPTCAPPGNSVNAATFAGHHFPAQRDVQHLPQPAEGERHAAHRETGPGLPPAHPPGGQHVVHQCIGVSSLFPRNARTGFIASMKSPRWRVRRPGREGAAAGRAVSLVGRTKSPRLSSCRIRCSSSAASSRRDPTAHSRVEGALRGKFRTLAHSPRSSGRPRSACPT